MLLVKLVTVPLDGKTAFPRAPALKLKAFNSKTSNDESKLRLELGFSKSTVVCLGRHWVKFQEPLSQDIQCVLISYLNRLKSPGSFKTPPTMSGLWKIGSSKVIRLYQRERSIRSLPTWNLWKRRQEQVLSADHEESLGL